jgi:haloacetate dehalogenase
VGHDRGSRVAYRLALDRPECLTRVALVNLVPTVKQFERMGAGPSLGYWPWFLVIGEDDAQLAEAPPVWPRI